MTRDDWNQLNDQLETQMLLIQGWPREDPNPVAIRCEQSRHRTLAHLRSCQEQWLSVVSGFAERESPNVQSSTLGGSSHARAMPRSPGRFISNNSFRAGGGGLPSAILSIGNGVANGTASQTRLAGLSAAWPSMRRITCVWSHTVTVDPQYLVTAVSSALC